MASIIPIDQVTVGNGTITLLSTTCFPANIVSQAPQVHRIFLQAANGNTAVITVKYASKVVGILAVPATTGALPELNFLGDDNVGNNLTLANFTLTGTQANDKVQGYVVIC